MNDEEDFAEFVAARWDGLVKAACALGCSQPDAEDLVQTTLIRCFVAWKRVRKSGNPAGYVYRSMLNQHRTSRRRRWWGERPLDPSLDIRVADKEVDNVIMLHQAMNRLSLEHRRVLVARHIVGLSERETAEALNLPPGTVKSRLSRALSKLAQDPGLVATHETGSSR